MGDDPFETRAMKIMGAISIIAGFAAMIAGHSLGDFLAGVVGAWGVMLIGLAVVSHLIPARWDRKKP